MEVHHAHHLHKRKKWTEYLLEGIMIFVAVSLGYTAENIREHHVETRKALKSLQNLYNEVVDDSAEYVSSLRVRRKQDSFFTYVNQAYSSGAISLLMPEFYVSHHYMVYRAFPKFNTNSLEQIKNTGMINFVEDDSLKAMIQQYSQDVREMYMREQRESGFLDRMVDPLTSKFFYYQYYGGLTEQTQKYSNGKVEVMAPIPRNVTLNKSNEFDWPSYITIMGQLSSIRQSSEFYYLDPARQRCYALLVKLRAYIQASE